MANSIQSVLEEEHYDQIFSGFQKWHIGDFIRLLNQNNNKGGVLPFVRGLRLSAQLIYAIREILSGTKLKANWGHILDKDGNFCSRECDIIIHRKGHKRKWNGRKGGIMDFRFIENEKAVAVISCKSFVTSGLLTKEATYCDEMKKFVDKVWFFGECCSPESVTSLSKKATSIGFDSFWYAYTWDKKTNDTKENYVGWNQFIKEIQKLK